MERLSKSLTINPEEGQIDSKSTESSCLQDKDSAVEAFFIYFIKKERKGCKQGSANLYLYD